MGWIISHFYVWAVMISSWNNYVFTQKWIVFFYFHFKSYFQMKGCIFLCKENFHTATIIVWMSISIGIFIGNGLNLYFLFTYLIFIFLSPWRRVDWLQYFNDIISFSTLTLTCPISSTRRRILLFRSSLTFNN